MKDRRYLTFPQLFALLMLGGGLYFFLGSSGLYLWAQGQQNPRARTLFTAAALPMKEWAEDAGIAAPLRTIRERFHHLKETPFGLIVRDAAPGAAQTAGEAPKETVGKTPPLQGGEARAAVTIKTPAPDRSEGNPASEALEASESPGAPPAGEDGAAGVPAEPEGAPSKPEEEASLTGGTPVSREQAGQAPPIRRILLMGDSLANSTATALVPLVDQIPEIELVNHGKVSSNLSNPVFTDWFAEVDTLLAAHQFHTVILMLGANAAQSISFENREVPWDTPEWNRIYRDRAARLISKLKAHTEQVVWVGIPPMLSRGYRERMERQNQIIREICRENGISFLPIDKILGDQEGKYTDYKTLEGRQVKLRLSDNIHYSPAGADLLSRHLIESLFPGLLTP